MNQDVLQRLREAFAFKDVEWKIQVTTQDKAKGMAVAYIDSRAIQNRLDEAVGAFNWRNTFVPWQDNSQICGLSIYDSDRESWVTKFDGAENTDIEPIKGGLSDSMKRAACVWGIGRYLYEIPSLWVEIEQRGKSSVIKDSQYSKLEAEYNRVVARMFGSAPTKAPASTPVPVQNQHQTPVAPANNVTPTPRAAGEAPTANAPIEAEFRVHSVKPSGKSSQLLELVDSGGEVVAAYVRNNDMNIKTGSTLRDVSIVQKQSSYGNYNLINDYKVAA